MTAYEYALWADVCDEPDAIEIYGTPANCQHATYKPGRCSGTFRINDPVEYMISGWFWWRCGDWPSGGEQFCGIHKKIRNGSYHPGDHLGSRDRRRASKVGAPDSPAQFYRRERFGSA